VLTVAVAGSLGLLLTRPVGGALTSTFHWIEQIANPPSVGSSSSPDASIDRGHSLPVDPALGVAFPPGPLSEASRTDPVNWGMNAPARSLTSNWPTTNSGSPVDSRRPGPFTGRLPFSAIRASIPVSHGHAFALGVKSPQVVSQPVALVPTALVQTAAKTTLPASTVHVSALASTMSSTDFQPAASEAFTVTTNADTNTAGTFRNAINQAVGFNGSVTINFDASIGTVTLTSDLPSLTNSNTIAINTNGNTVSGSSGGIVLSAGTLQFGDGTDASTLVGAVGGTGAIGSVAITVNNSAALQILQSAAVTGGAGGQGSMSSSRTGGNGGVAVLFSGAGSLSNSGTITGGAGGQPFMSAAAGTGAIAVVFNNGGSFNNTGTITGGSGGRGATGSGNSGGAGLSFGGTGTWSNTGTISGGNGPNSSGGSSGSAGGTGVIFTTTGSWTNGGTVNGGSGTRGNTGGPLGGIGILLQGSGSSLTNNLNINGGTGSGGTGVYFQASGSLNNTGGIDGGALGSGGTAASGLTGNNGVVFQAGGTVVNSGTIQGSDGAGFPFGVSGGMGVDFAGSGSMNNSGTITGGLGNNVGGGGNGGVAVFFSGGGSLTNSGTIQGGEVDGGGAGAAGAGATFSGGQGTLENDKGGQITGGVVMDNFANQVTLQIGSTITGNLNIGTSASATLLLTDDGSGGTQTYSTAVTGTTTFAGTLTKNGPGTWYLDEAMSYGGGTIINAGTLAIAADTALGAAGTTVALNSGTLQANGSFTSTRPISVGSGSFNTNGNAVTLSGAISGGTFTKTGLGTLTLGGAADNVGLSVTVSAGTLVLAKTNSNSLVHAVGGGGLDIEGGTVQLGGSGGDEIYDGTGVTMNGGTFDLNGQNETIAALSGTGGSIVNNGSSASTLTMTSASSTSFTGTAGNGGAGVTLVQGGTGTLTLGGTNDNGFLSVTVTKGMLILAKTSTAGVHAIGNGLDIEGGTVQLAGSGGDQIFNSAPVIVNSGTFDLNGQSEIIGALSGTSGSIVNTGSSATTLTMTSALSTSFTGTAGSGGAGLTLVQGGSGTLTLGGMNDNGFLSATVTKGTLILAKTSTAGVHAIGNGLDIEGGTVQLGGSGGDQIFNSAPVIVNGGTFDLNGQNETIGALSGSGSTITNTGSSLATLTIGGSNATGAGTYSGKISDGTGPVALIKAGTGTLLLVGQNTFTGTTTVSSGTLAVNGSIAASSIVSVSIGGKLSGHGSVSEISGAGTVSPGGGQILTATQVDPSQNLGFTFSFNQPGAPNYGTVGASGNDVLHLTSTTPFVMALALTAANTVTLDFSGTSLSLGQVYYGGFFTDATVPASTFNSANFVYTGTGGPTVQYEGLAPVSIANFATGTVTNGEIMEFQVIAVPEPGSFCSALAGLLFLAGTPRFRQRRP
jgi:fibronectin-binding autotransporter adhesin